MSGNKKNILVIGAPNTGKTHFGGQLYGRLKIKESEYVLRETPDDITLFKDILNKLNNGIPGDHTPFSESRQLILPITSKNGEEIDLIYPDYGGEQISQIIKNRKLNARWQEQIELSTDWILFIRPHLIETIEDVTKRFHSYIFKKSQTELAEFEGLKDTSPIFYIELLQMLLFSKRLNVTSTNKPFLLIFLTCWDELNITDEEPKKVLKSKMPLFYEYIENNWNLKFATIGLSATGTVLDANKPNKEFQIYGPETCGYIINEDGSKTTDLTLALKPLFDINK